MAKLLKGSSSLNSFRSQIDEIDDGIQDLLMRRIELATSIGKEKGSVAGKLFRPAREAQIIRRMAARHQGAFPFPVMIRIWREIIGASLLAEGRFVVSVYMPEPLEAGLAYLALARAHFGSQTPILQAQTEAGVLRAVRDNKASVGVLPTASDTHTTRASAEPWWYTLVAGGTERPHVVASLPWSTPNEINGNSTYALAVACVQPESSGDDLSLIAFESTENVSRDRIRKIAEEIGLSLDWAATWSHKETSTRWQLAEVDGFVSEADDRLADLFSSLDGNLTNFVNLGCYARLGENV